MMSLFAVAALLCAPLVSSVAAVSSSTGTGAVATSQIVVNTKSTLTARQAMDIFLAGLDPNGNGVVPYVGVPTFLDDNGLPANTCNGVDRSSVIRTFTAGDADVGFTNGIIFTGDCDLVATINLAEGVSTSSFFYFSTMATQPSNSADTYDISVNGAEQSSFNTADLPDSPQPGFGDAIPSASGRTPVALSIPAGTTRIRIRLNSHWFNQQDQGTDGEGTNDDKSSVALSPIRVTGRLVGDPQFTGFMNQEYQIHGTANTHYSVISTPTFQYNALFSFLSQGECRTGTPCFSHPGNYFGAVGMSFKESADATEVTKVKVTAGPVATGLSMEVNGQAKQVGESVQVGDYTVTLRSAFQVSLESSEFNLVLDNSDMLLNQLVSIGTKLQSKISSAKLALKAGGDVEAAKAKLPHGLLGQTWELKTYPNRWQYIQGDLMDYVETDLFASSSRFSRF